MLLKIITIFLFIKNQTIFHSFLLQQVFLLILKKSPFSYLRSKISNIRKHLPNKKRNLLDLPSSFQYSIHPQFTKFLSQEYPHLFTIKHWPKNPIITIHIPPLECIFQTKKKKKCPRIFLLLLLHPRPPRRNSETVQTLLSNRPIFNPRIPPTGISTYLEKCWTTRRPAQAWNGPNFIKRPGGHSWKSETALSRLTNEPPTEPLPRGFHLAPRGLLMHTSRSFPCEAFEREAAFSGNVKSDASRPRGRAMKNPPRRCDLLRGRVSNADGIDELVTLALRSLHWAAHKFLVSRWSCASANWSFFSFQNIYLYRLNFYLFFFFELINFEAFLFQEIISLRILSNDNNNNKSKCSESKDLENWFQKYNRHSGQIRAVFEITSLPKVSLLRAFCS